MPRLNPDEMTEDRALVARWIGDRSQSTAAEELGCSQQFLSKWFAHTRDLRPATIRTWAATLSKSERRQREIARILLDGAGNIERESA